MFTAADLIHAVLRRLQLVAPHLRRPPGEFPPGWKQWFESMPVRAGAITGATAQALVEVFLQRPLAERPRRAGDLTRWQAFNTLWRQEWAAPEPEDRKLRLFAGSVTAAWHVIFALLVLWFWVGQLRYVEEASKRRGEEVVQIEFIGRGAPEEAGGGETQGQPAEVEVVEAPRIAAAEPAQPQPAPPTPESEAPATDAAVPDIAQRDIPEPQLPPSPPAQQDVAVSAPVPDASDFVLTAPTPRIEQPQLRAPEINAPAAPLQAVEVPEPVQPIRREVAPRPVTAPQVEARIPEIAQREVAAPVSRPDVPKVAAPVVPQPALRVPEARVSTREVPAPSASPAAQAAATAARPDAAPATTEAASRPATGGPAATMARPSGTSPSTASSGQGPRPVTAPGGFPTPARSDDWGASERNVPGGQRGEPLGLYNAEGGPRLAERPVNTGQPPGTIDDRIVDLDRSGTWLKRKPTDYEPTVFDEYWRPSETLLAEWVRKGVKKMAIPIPGTSKKIDCVISLLALGGACGISDPNLNDQPAVARPPPDIPFKPHLQEDNGSVKPEQGG